jgi:hypothetical protein
MLRVEAVALLGIAAILAGPVPAALARAQWPTRAPRAALVLWQAIGLGGGLSILGAGCTLVASSLGGRLVPGITSLPQHWQDLGALGWTSLVLTTALALWLAGAAITSGARTTLARRSHRQRLDVVAWTLESEAGHLVDADPYRVPDSRAHPLASRLAGRRALIGTSSGRARLQLPNSPDGRRDLDLVGVQVVDHPAAVAYCLPGFRSRIVVSRGAIDALPDGQLRAVVAHERAHAQSRHDLVVQPFIAWRATFPFLPTATTALRAVEQLVEMLADDRARRSSPPSHLQEALRQLASRHSALALSHDQLTTQVAARATRLSTPPQSLPRPLGLVIYLTAIALLVAPPVALLLG